jgi:hypothetical protein
VYSYVGAGCTTAPNYSRDAQRSALASDSRGVRLSALTGAVRPFVPGTSTAGNMLLDGGHPHSHPVRGRRSNR